MKPGAVVSQDVGDNGQAIMCQAPRRRDAEAGVASSEQPARVPHWDADEGPGLALVKRLQWRMQFGLRPLLSTAEQPVVEIPKGLKQRCARAAVPWTSDEPADQRAGLKTMPLFFRIITLNNSADEDLDPLAGLKTLIVMQQGGPGGGGDSLLALVDPARQDALWHGAVGRDGLGIILPDHRGVGFSAKLQCRGTFGSVLEKISLDQGSEGFSLESMLKTARKNVARCIDNLGGYSNMLPDDVSVTAAAGDLHALIGLLREHSLIGSVRPAVHLYGVSYGTYVVQRFMHLFPRGADSFTIDGVISAHGFTFRDFDSYADMVGRRLIKLCAEDDTCNGFFKFESPDTAASELQQRIEALVTSETKCAESIRRIRAFASKVGPEGAVPADAPWKRTPDHTSFFSMMMRALGGMAVSTGRDSLPGSELCTAIADAGFSESNKTCGVVDLRTAFLSWLHRVMRCDPALGDLEFLFMPFIWQGALLSYHPGYQDSIHLDMFVYNTIKYSELWDVDDPNLAAFASAAQKEDKIQGIWRSPDLLEPAEVPLGVIAAAHAGSVRSSKIVEEHYEELRKSKERRQMFGPEAQVISKSNGALKLEYRGKSCTDIIPQNGQRWSWQAPQFNCDFFLLDSRRCAQYGHIVSYGYSAKTACCVCGGGTMQSKARGSGKTTFSMMNSSLGEGWWQTKRYQDDVPAFDYHHLAGDDVLLQSIQKEVAQADVPPNGETSRTSVLFREGTEAKYRSQLRQELAIWQGQWNNALFGLCLFPHDSATSTAWPRYSRDKYAQQWPPNGAIDAKGGALPPLLVLTGGLDAHTPEYLSHWAVGNLSKNRNTVHLIVPGGGHGTIMDHCGSAGFASFLEGNSTTESDFRACVAADPVVNFQPGVLDALVLGKRGRSLWEDDICHFDAAAELPTVPAADWGSLVANLFRSKSDREAEEEDRDAEKKKRGGRVKAQKYMPSGDELRCGSYRMRCVGCITSCLIQQIFLHTSDEVRARITSLVQNLADRLTQGAQDEKEVDFKTRATIIIEEILKLHSRDKSILIDALCGCADVMTCNEPLARQCDESKSSAQADKMARQILPTLTHAGDILTLKGALCPAPAPSSAPSPLQPTRSDAPTRSSPTTTTVARSSDDVLLATSTLAPSTVGPTTPSTGASSKKHSTDWSARTPLLIILLSSFAAALSFAGLFYLLCRRHRKKRSPWSFWARRGAGGSVDDTMHTDTLLEDMGPTLDDSYASLTTPRDHELG